MTATVEQTQHDLSQLIRLAAGGEEIVITQEGKPVAKLTGIAQPQSGVDQHDWLHSLRQLRDATATGKTGAASEDLISRDRTERDL
jgi:prevent-host-death family protein